MATIDQQLQMTQAQRLELVGNYALRITWGDGHSAGIYDFDLLRALAAPSGPANAPG
jgi:DUF971 family protein